MIQNHIALITDGNRSIGRETALALPDMSTDVIITYNVKSAEVDKIVNALKAKGVKTINNFIGFHSPLC
jgi:NAD(P)-dependent dehydrogenase (short-subunit alcohol dehydrogenase family)